MINTQSKSEPFIIDSNVLVVSKSENFIVVAELDTFYLQKLSIHIYLNKKVKDLDLFVLIE